MYVSHLPADAVEEQTLLSAAILNREFCWKDKYICIGDDKFVACKLK